MFVLFSFSATRLSSDLIVSNEPGTNAEKFDSYLVQMLIAEFYAE